MHLLLLNPDMQNLRADRCTICFLIVTVCVTSVSVVDCLISVVILFLIPLPLTLHQC